MLELKSMGAVVMTLALKQQLSTQGYYWYNLPKDAGYPFLALVEHTNYVSPEHFGDQARKEIIDKSNNQNVDMLLADLSLTQEIRKFDG